MQRTTMDANEIGDRLGSGKKKTTTSNALKHVSHAGIASKHAQRRTINKRLFAVAGTSTLKVWQQEFVGCAVACVHIKQFRQRTGV